MLALLLAIAVTALDQWSKQWVRESLPFAESRPVLAGFLNLTHLRNSGAAWGMLGGQNAPLVLLSIVMLSLLVIFRRSFLSPTRSHRIALGLLVGGIVGNMLDRIRLAYVTDFIDVHVGIHHWPAFNVADSAICVGVGVYVVSTWIADRRARRTAAAPDGGTAPTGGPAAA
jgi:signal peptidase II